MRKGDLVESSLITLVGIEVLATRRFIRRRGFVRILLPMLLPEEPPVRGRQSFQGLSVM